MSDQLRKPLVAVVGASGTVGLELMQRLEARHDLVVYSLGGRAPRSELYTKAQRADVVVLCLPEAAAAEFVAHAPASMRILDASPAHRTAEGWVYGLPELNATQSAQIRQATRVANPGCYATGAILLMRPLMACMVQPSLQVAITAVGGVSAGGQRMLNEAQDSPFGYRLFGLDQAHRHIPEIQQYSGLQSTPIFMPAVAAHQRGTVVQIPFSASQLGLSYTDVCNSLRAAYRDTPGVKFVERTEPRFIDASELAGQDGVVIQVFADETEERFVLVAQFDNLGRGAAGAAETNLTLMLGLA